ncbi:MAG: hypothetical protein Q4B63_04640 [Clostridium perfringens]|nr:hypothetical protein [Clostridium perfringens]
MKKLIVFILSTLMIFTCGCYRSEKETEEQKEEVINLSFDNNIASSIADTYMNAFAIGDVKGMKSLGSGDFQKGFDGEINTNVEVLGIRQEEANQNGLSALYEYTIIKAMKNEPRAYLQSYYLTIGKEDNTYKVESAKAVPQYEVFREGQQLKIRKEDEVEIANIMMMKNLPDAVYSQNDSGDVVMLKVPNKEYGPVGISFTGQNVALSTTDGLSTYVGVVEIDESTQTASQSSGQSGSQGGQGSGGSSGGNQGENQGDEIYFDKLVGKNITTIDIYNNITIKNIVFSKDDSYIAVNYENENSVTRFKFYKATGEIVGLDLDSTFSSKKYNLIYKDYKDDEVYFEVTGVKNAEGIVENLLGNYKISTKDFKINKL